MTWSKFYTTFKVNDFVFKQEVNWLKQDDIEIIYLTKCIQSFFILFEWYIVNSTQYR